jgi:hypothetical protein
MKVAELVRKADLINWDEAPMMCGLQSLVKKMRMWL